MCGPETRVIMLTASSRANAVAEEVAAGAAGYLQRVAYVDQVIAMIKGAVAGEERLPTLVVGWAIDRIWSGVRRREDVDLTPREKAERLQSRSAINLSESGFTGLKDFQDRNPNNEIPKSKESQFRKRLRNRLGEKEILVPFYKGMSYTGLQRQGQCRWSPSEMPPTGFKSSWVLTRSTRS